MNRIFRISAATAAIIAAIVFVLYLFLHAEDYLLERIKHATDDVVSVDSVGFRWNMVSAKNVLVKAEDGSGFLAVEKLRVGISFFSLLKKKIDIKYIEAGNVCLNIQRTEQGKWLFPVFKRGDGTASFSISSIDVNNSTINIVDRLRNANLALNNVQVSIARTNPVFSSSKIKYSGTAKTGASGSLRIEGSGDAAANIYKGSVQLKDININDLRSYMQGRSRVKRGLISIDSSVVVKNGYVEAPSKLRLRNIDIEKGDVLMGVAGSLIIEMLKKDDEIYLEFNIWGRWNNLQNDLSDVFHKKILTETGRTMISPVEGVVKGIGKLLPF
ncbi:MAG: DUF748 domain-containing protein [Dissulfurispiraceae bacterium]|nr:DUF748 domain-containing protein [Dissulfurispiraceae bacterium]